MRPGGNLLFRLAVYYGVLLVALFALERALPGIVPGPVRAVAGGITADGFPASAAAASPAATPSAHSALAAAVAMLGAVLLAVPVAWVYVATRARRGYQQSVVQTLVILPMVVAGVVALVKDSLPLAFGLAAIVAAVRFRTSLDDSKDAVYVFLATSIGLAASVDLPVAAVVSVLFNATVLVLWQSDFGRTPPALEGRVAERRMQEVMEEASRTGTFVARMDDEVFSDMSAEQLQAVADRAWRRSRRNNPEAPDAEGRREALLRIHTDDVQGARRVVEPLLDEHVKRWRYGGVVHDVAGDIMEYVVTLRRGAAPDDVLAVLRNESAPIVTAAVLE